MQPDNTTPNDNPAPAPDQQPGVVIGGMGSSDTAPASMPPQDSPKKSKKLLWAVLLLVVAVAVVVGVIVGLHKSDDTKTPVKKDDSALQSNNPAHLKGIAVGTFRYVNACQVLSGQMEIDNFAPLAGAYLLTQTYAENGLPVNLISSTNGVVSSCSRTFGEGTVFDGTTMTFSIAQYPTAAAAKAAYGAYSITQDQLNQGNQKFGTSTQTDYAPVSGIANTVYSPSTHIAATLLDNKVMTFTGLLGTVTDSQFQASVVKVLPAVIANAQSTSLIQTPTQSADYGQTVGPSTKLLDPCTVLTAGAFQKITGGAQDPTNIEVRLNYDATKYLNTDKSSGDANNTCTRTSLPNVKKSQTIEAQVDYFQDASEASQQVKQAMADRAADTALGEKIVPVAGVGDYAAYAEPTDKGRTVSYFFVQKGAYVLELHISLGGDAWGSKQYPTSADYTTAAQALLPNLP